MGLFKRKSKKPITELIKIHNKDPSRNAKIKYVEGVNRISDLINSTERDIENRITVFISIISSGLLGAFLATKEYKISILIASVLLIILIFTLIKENKDKKDLHEKLDELVNEAKKVGLDLDFKKRKAGQLKRKANHQL